MDSRLSQLEEHVTSLQGKVEAIETSRSAPQVELQPILDLISSSSEAIKKSVDATLNEYRTELNEVRCTMGTIAETR